MTNIINNMASSIENNKPTEQIKLKNNNSANNSLNKDDIEDKNPTDQEEETELRLEDLKKNPK
eukprot:CAMPEP_0194389608 /NCGR_PEP_ID=MMETSP0174-20130528/105010_1 /TAXON_ID=216777 /ORGANISM="Proboscia alata, Strain PI-D3" /LENGTH=62 /DNA_ID=CAMNT_0039182027 /DNA_START=21 /DNA_END=209 /DNA_ORIENTATION=+